MSDRATVATGKDIGKLARAMSGLASMPKPDPRAVVTAFAIAILMTLVFWGASPSTRLEQLAAANNWTPEQGPAETRQISYTEGIALLKSKSVASVIENVSDINPTRIIELKLQNGALRWFRSTLGKTLDEAVEGSGADVHNVNANATSRIVSMMSLISSLMVILLFGFMFINMARKFFTSPARIVRPGKNPVRFSDVEGQPEAVAAMREIIAVMNTPIRYATMGAKMPAGVLLVGPPGNGKTLLAKATAAEAGVPFLYVSGSDFLEMFAGLGARRVRTMFKLARRIAGTKGCIIFIDEFDIVGGTRGQGTGGDVSSERDQTVTALLTELSGMEKRTGVFLLAATNRPDLLDAAVVRPGRIDKQINVIAPDGAARGRILAVHCRNLALAPDVDPMAIGQSMPGASGADLANLANMAALRAVHRNQSTVDDKCFQDARDELLMGEARLGSEPHPKEIRIAALHEAGHALLSVLQDECDPVYKATVVERKASLGQVVTLAVRDWKTMSRSKITALLTVLMAGRAAEEAVDGADAMTTGAAQDIQQATAIARNALGRYGMHRDLGMVDYVGTSPGSPVASPAAMERLDEAVRHLIDACHASAMKTIQRNSIAHHELARALEINGTLTGDQVRAIIREFAVETCATQPQNPWGAPRDTTTPEPADAAPRVAAIA